MSGAAALNALWAAMGVVAGAAIAFQAPLNAQLARAVGSPIAAATISFLAGTVALVAVTTILVGSGGASLTGRNVPPWLFVAGGLLGASFVTSSIVLTPKLGAAAFLGLAVAGQLAAGLLMDHFGLFGLVPRELSLGRLAGAVLLIVGAVLVRVA